MKRIGLIVASLGLCIGTLQAQNSITDILQSIEQNNTSLKALKEGLEAEKLSNKTDIYLPGPEVEFNYLWGDPSIIGHRTDIRATQQVDFATVSGRKRNVANQQNALVDLQYKAERIDVLCQAKQLCLDLIYYNALMEALQIRQEYAQQIAAAQQKRVESGDSNQLELNNVTLSLATIEGEMTRIAAERNAVLSTLGRLNGGEAVEMLQNTFPEVNVPLSFEAWYEEAEAKSPLLAYVKQEVTLSEKQVSLSRSLRWPALTVGYMSEKTTDQNFRGVTLGLSVPLWANKNRVRQAKTAQHAAELKVADTKLQFYNQLEIQYNKTVDLQRVANTLERSLAQANNCALLKRAYDEGAISVLEYLVQMGLYYDAVNQTLAAERDFQKAYCELTSVAL
jgi:outer membrane protein TolC